MLDAHRVPRRHAGRASRLMFPPVHSGDDPRFHDPILQHPLLASGSLPVPSLDDEGALPQGTLTPVLDVPEHLIPSTADLEHDTLPIEQHPSYPFGNPYDIFHAPSSLQPVGSSQPKLDPRVHSRLSLHVGADSRRSGADALACVAEGSAHAHAAVDDASDDEVDAHPSYAIEPDGRVVLAPHLQLRAQIGSKPAPPTWPFPRFGPGPSTRPYAMLFRSNWANESQPEVDVWADLGLEALVPRARPDHYSLPSTLRHPYARNAGRRRRARPSGLPAALGAETAARDAAWLDDGVCSEIDVQAVRAAAEAPSTLAHDDLFGPVRGASRRASTAWMNEHHDFYRTLLGVCARKRRVEPPNCSSASSERKRACASPRVADADAAPWSWGEHAPSHAVE